MNSNLIDLAQRAHDNPDDPELQTEMQRRNDEIIAAFQEFGKAIQNAMSAIAKVAQQFIETVAEIVQEVVRVFRYAYQEAGSPYGDDDIAMWRWLHEQAALMRIRYEWQRWHFSLN